MTTTEVVVDKLLEATVIGSFSRVGYQVRSRLGHWSPPTSMTGRTVLITGATSGLGRQAALDLACSGASVWFVARNQERGDQTRAVIARSANSPDVSFVRGDLSDPESVRRVAAAVMDRLGSLDVLIHNAGALTRERQVAPDGTELTVATHVLGPFLLTTLLLPLLRKAAPARVVTVSSGGMYTQRFDLERLEMDDTRYDGVVAYARAKRAQLILNHEWARRVEGSEVAFHAMHPGWADTPGVHSSLPGFHRIMGRLLRSPSQGADTMVWLASAPEVLQAPSGSFWLDRRRRSEHKVPWTRPADASSDQERLWAWCAERTASDRAGAEQ